MTIGTKLSKARLAAFVAPEAPFSAFLTVLVVFVPPFYAGSAGLGLSTVGLIFGLTKIWDVITDPAFGYLADHWHTRWGRRLPWLVASVPALGLCTYMVFVPTLPVDGTYFAIWMVLLYVGWTIGTVSHIAWAAELSEEYHERSRISAYKQGAALVGSLGIILLVVLADGMGELDEPDRMQLIAVALIVLLPITIFAAVRAAPEPRFSHIQTSPDAPGVLRQIVGNRPLRLLLLANLLLGIAAGGVGGMVLFYVEDALLLGSWSSFTLIPFLFSGLLFLPLLVAASRRFGKHRTLCYALMYQIVGGSLFLVIPAGNVVAACAVFLLLGVSQAVGNYLPQAIMADVTDMDTAATGKRRTALYMSLLQSSSKVAAALAVGLSYPILSLVGFDPSPDAAHPESALFGLRMMMFLFPAIALALVVWVMWNFPLSEKDQLVLRQRIAERVAS